MSPLSDDLRLLIFLAVQGAIVFAAWRFAGRFAASRLQRAVDAGWITALVIYAAVGLPGVLQCLSAGSMIAVALPASIFLAFASFRGDYVMSLKAHGSAVGSRAPNPAISRSISAPNHLSNEPSRTITFAALLTIGYLTALIWQQRYLPPMATDALTYHLPAAVQWLQHGRIDLFQTWLFNPANTYSPLGGSIFYTWLIGIVRCDALVNLGPAAMTLLLILAVIATVREMLPGEKSDRRPPVSLIVAALAGLSLALSRPIVSQIDKAKDDLFLVAFFAVAVFALSPRRLRDPLGPWRLGVAIGLSLSIKYTALLSLPILLLAIDAPVRAGWRLKQWAMAIACTTAIAAPWYVRNAIIAGNPIFPTACLHLPALFSTARSGELRTLPGILGVLTSGPFAVPGWLAGAIGIAWLVATIHSCRQIVRDPVARVCTIGPIVGVAIFLAVSPYPEIRFLLPTLAIMAMSIGLLPKLLQLLAAIAVAVAAVCTTFSGSEFSDHLLFVVVGIGVGIVATVVVHFAGKPARSPRSVHQMAIAVVAVSALIAVLLSHFWWPQFVVDRAGDAPLAWQARDPRGNVWAFVRDHLPAADPIAYAGTFTVYPLMGDAFDRPVMYIPVRRDLRLLADLPWLGSRLPGEQIDRTAVAAENAEPDAAAWLASLHASGAKHLLILTSDTGVPPELEMVRANSVYFSLEYQDSAGAVFAVR